MEEEEVVVVLDFQLLIHQLVNYLKHQVCLTTKPVLTEKIDLEMIVNLIGVLVTDVKVQEMTFYLLKYWQVGLVVCQGWEVVEADLEIQFVVDPFLERPEKVGTGL